MVPIIPLEPQQDYVVRDVVAPFVQGKACRCGCVWGLLWVVRVFKGAYKWVLSWVKIPFAHMTGGAAPRATHYRCTDQRSASRAAILALLLATALVNCSSLHVEHTFLTASCNALGFLKRNW